MAALGRSSGEAFASSPIRLAAIGVACVLLTTFFLIRGFPFDELGARLATVVEQRTGSQVSFQQLGPHLSLGGPAIEALGVRVVTARGSRYQLDEARLRPAWSLAWLSLEPAIHVDLMAPDGRALGVVTLGEQLGFAGDVTEVDLAKLPVATFWPGASLRGSFEVSGDVRAADAGPEGAVFFTAREGAIEAPGLPMALPFQEMTGDLNLGGEGFVEIVSLDVQGMMFTAQAAGTVGRGRSFSQAPLDLRIEIEAEPQLAPMLERVGIRTRNGKATLRVGGTAAAPSVR